MLKLKIKDRKVRNVDVGIRTSGAPVLEKSGEHTFLKNMLIGDGFHWQQVIPALLPGEVIPYKAAKTGNELALSDSNISLINRVPLETYLECVVGSEMNPEAPIEFLKAHAVISRSWVLGKILNSHPNDSEGMVNNGNELIGWDDTASHKGFHVCSDDHCQRYQGLQPLENASLEAVRQTLGEVLMTPEGEVVDARFSKCCGGRTELFETCWQSRKMDCIESFDDPWCDLSGLSEEKRNKLLKTILKDYDMATQSYGFRWTSEISKDEIRENLLSKFKRDIGEILSLKVLHRGPSGRIDLLKIEDIKGSLSIGKELWIRRLLSDSHLYSSAFEIENRGDRFILHGRGWGHGAGLCQIGAANMAASGHDYRSILSFYYPGSKIIRL